MVNWANISDYIYSGCVLIQTLVSVFQAVTPTVKLIKKEKRFAGWE